MRLVWLFMVVVMTIATATEAWFERQEAHRYLEEGRKVMGRVIETHPEGHNTLIVAYTVSGLDFRARTRGTRLASSYQPGEPIQVYYNASAPAQGFCVEPRWDPETRFLFFGITAGLGPLWLIGGLGMMVRRILKTRFAKALQDEAA